MDGPAPRCFPRAAFCTLARLLGGPGFAAPAVIPIKDLSAAASRIRAGGAISGAGSTGERGSLLFLRRWR